MDDGTKRALKDYSSLLAYLIPGLAIVVFVNIFLIPRFERIAQEFGADTPGPLAAMLSGFRFFFHNFYFAIPLLLLPIILAEIFSRFWRSNRPLFFGVLKWVFVFSIMIALVTLGTSALALIPFATQP